MFPWEAAYGVVQQQKYRTMLWEAAKSRSSKKETTLKISVAPHMLTPFPLDIG
jgi:hypothetical protein